MNRLYQQLPLFLLLLGAAMGCTPAEDAQHPDATDALTFRTTLEGLSIEPATRAVSGDVDLAALGFTVVGYHTDESFPLSDASKAVLVPNIFDKIADAAKTPVRKVNAGINFKLPLAKIPLDDLDSSVRTHFSFFAWTAAVNKNAAGTAVDVIKAATATATDKGSPFIDVELPAPDAQAQGDVAVAHALNAPNDYVVTAVDLDFHHVFSKLSFQAKATSGAVVKLISTQLRYAAGSVYTRARYEFNASDSVGSWKSFTAPQAAGDVTPYGFNAPSLTTTSAYLGSMLMIPQSCKAGALSLVVNYTVTVAGKVSTPITRTVPIVLDMRQGKHYTYTLNIETEKMEVINLSVGGWKDAGKVNPMPLIPGPMGDVLLLLEGYDKPYKHSDGKWYWLDRSGYNRHCEIVGYADGMYSESDRSYAFVRNTRRLIVPSLGSVTELTMDVVAQQTGDISTSHQQTIVLLSKTAINPNTTVPNRQLFVHLGWTQKGDIYLDTEGLDVDPPRLKYVIPSGNSFFKNKIMWTFQKKDGGKSSLYNNALWLADSAGPSITSPGTLGTLSYNTIAYDYEGTVSHVKISKKKQTAGEISKDFAGVMQRYKIDKIKGKYLPAVQDGLFACWDGRSGLLDYADNGNNAIWVDQAGEGVYMTCEVPANCSVTHNATTNAIESRRTGRGDKLTMVNTRTFPSQKALTIEVVAQSIPTDYDYFMWIYLKDNKNNPHWIYLRPNTGSGYSTMEAAASFCTGLGVGLDGTIARQKRSLHYVFDSDTQMVTFYQNGVKIGEKSSTFIIKEFSITQLLMLRRENTDGGGFFAYNGDIYAYRMYNRALTLAEIQANYAADKTTFGLP